jgi:hypothetical protein
MCDTWIPNENVSARTLQQAWFYNILENLWDIGTTKQTIVTNYNIIGQYKNNKAAKPYKLFDKQS